MNSTHPFYHILITSAPFVMGKFSDMGNARRFFSKGQKTQERGITAPPPPLGGMVLNKKTLT